MPLWSKRWQDTLRQDGVGQENLEHIRHGLFLHSHRLKREGEGEGGERGEEGEEEEEERRERRKRRRKKEEEGRMGEK